MKCNLIPMAGAGKRFSDAGYSLPKPLIPVNDKPMILSACDSLPSADKWIFVVRSEHERMFPLRETLSSAYKNLSVISIDYLTEGQASTCFLAEKEIADNDSLLIGPCDNGMTWNRQKYEALIKSENVDALIWTFRNNPTVRRNPAMYGWVAVDKDDNAQKVSCKIPLSDNPINDHAVVGTFYFRKSVFFKDAYLSMVGKKRKTNNEYYVDVLMNELIEKGLKVKVFEIDKYICWGTPDDLKVYDYWKDFFSRGINIK
jgi:dTDP-glucose pyrophosphorylase